MLSRALNGTGFCKMLLKFSLDESQEEFERKMLTLRHCSLDI